MERIRALLYLNQLETATPPAAEPVDLADLVRRRVEAAEARVNLRLPSSAVLDVPLAHAEMLVGNLLDNAVKYAAPGSAVDLELSECSHGFRLAVTNATAEPVQWDPGRIFEPFYRPDRSRNSRTGGNGLGLAICHAIAVANDWKLSVEDAGLRVKAEVGFRGER